MTRRRALVVAVALAACGGGDETEIDVPVPVSESGSVEGTRVAVREIRIGLETAPGTIAESVDFQPGDTVAVSAELEGSLEQTSVAARITGADGSVVVGQERFLPLDGQETVVFRLAPPGGFGPGSYRVELLVGGEGVAEKEFSVGG